jgi:hypothetical protein
MSRSKKRLAVIVSSVAVTAVAAGGVAFAAFTYSASASPSGGGTETFEPMTVTGTWLGHPKSGGGYDKLLLPGETGYVSLELKNPSGNTVQGEVATITPTLGNNCSGYFSASSYAPGNGLVLDANSTVTVILKDAVSVREDTPVACHNKQFAPTYTVVFKATRAAVNRPGDSTLTPVS